jgi:hypothetical protein
LQRLLHPFVAGTAQSSKILVQASPKILSVDNISLFPFKMFHKQIIKNSSASAQKEMENLKRFDKH